ncbi:hypothetical protein REPUB_Repub10bG0072100 [Reevesia pubescens]
MMKMGKLLGIGALVGAIAIAKQYGGALGLGLGLDKDAALRLFQQWSDQLGIWAIPLYVALHTLTLTLCLPYAVFFEAGASLIFGFFPAVLCVFSAKLLGASLSFWIGRLVFRSSSYAMNLVQRNKYFHLLSRGVERDGWRFVLLARFSPIPSYLINYVLAATKVGFVVDFLLPTVIGCLPMILQNASIGSLAGAAVATASGSEKSIVWSYILPLLGIVSSVVISLKIKKYYTDITSVESSSSDHINSSINDDSSQTSNGREGSTDLKKCH